MQSILPRDERVTGCDLGAEGVVGRFVAMVLLAVVGLLLSMVQILIALRKK